MSDRLPGSSESNPIYYRDYVIYLNPQPHGPSEDWMFHPEDMDFDNGEPPRYAPTQQAARCAIDDYLDEDYTL